MGFDCMLKIYPILLTGILLLMTIIAFAKNNPTPLDNALLTVKDLNQITAGTASLLSNNAQLTVFAIDASTKITTITLTSATNSANVAVSIAPDVLKTSRIAVGQTVRVVIQDAGTVLFLDKKAIAFIPNELGKNLFYSFPRD